MAEDIPPHTPADLAIPLLRYRHRVIVVPFQSVAAAPNDSSGSMLGGYNISRRTREVGVTSIHPPPWASPPTFVDSGALVDLEDNEVHSYGLGEKVEGWAQAGG